MGDEFRVDIDGTGRALERLKELLEKRFKESMGELYQEDLLKTSSDSISERWKEAMKKIAEGVRIDPCKALWQEPVIVMCEEIGRSTVARMMGDVLLNELNDEFRTVMDRLRAEYIFLDETPSLADTFEDLSSLASSSDDNPGLTDSQIRKMLKYEKNPMRIKQLNRMLSGNRKRG